MNLADLTVHVGENENPVAVDCTLPLAIFVTGLLIETIVLLLG